MEQATDILKKYWGYETFRELQGDIIQSVVDGKDTLALLPTGGGKSICFQVPAMMLDGMCLVVSPLIALMTDQVNQLKKRGIQASAITSGMPHREIDGLLDNCVFGKVKFLYVSPERLSSDLFIERAKRMPISLLAIDEAHCISQWGYDFRPSYLEIASIYPHMDGVRKIALTATATADVRQDIVEKLEFEMPVVFQKSFARKNLSYSIFELENKGPKLLEILNNVKGSAIVYVRSRKETQNVARYLFQNKIGADFYHAGLEPKIRAKKQEDWINNVQRVIVATNAFGMGIDKPDVRVVVHLDLPDTLEAYYQEAGRAGRDEKQAYAVLLFNKGDTYSLMENEKSRNPSLEFVQQVYQSIANYFKLATGSSEWQSFDFDIKEFCVTYKFHAREAHFAIKKLQEMGVIMLNDSQFKSSTLKFALSSNELYVYNISNVAIEPLIKALLRLYGGSLYNDFVNISEYDLAWMIGMAKEEVIQKLTHLSQSEVVIYDPAKTLPQLTYLTPRLAVAALKKPYNLLLPRQKVIHDKMMQVVGYVTSSIGCRTRVFQEYFDETTYINCGVCDTCLRAKKEAHLIESLEAAKQHILETVGNGVDHIEQVKSEAGIKNEFLFTESIRTLIDEERLRLEGYTRLVLL